MGKAVGHTRRTPSHGLSEAIPSFQAVCNLRLRELFAQCCHFDEVQLELVVLLLMVSRGIITHRCSTVYCDTTHFIEVTCNTWNF